MLPREMNRDSFHLHHDRSNNTYNLDVYIFHPVSHEYRPPCQIQDSALDISDIRYEYDDFTDFVIRDYPVYGLQDHRFNESLLPNLICPETTAKIILE
jgi:hypothetical protein